MTQKQRVLEHLKERGDITPLEAMELYGIMRLGARIWDLRSDGYAIKRETVAGKNRFGEATQYARYRLDAVE